jgi:hypothetical protein
MQFQFQLRTQIPFLIHFRISNTKPVQPQHFVSAGAGIYASAQGR